MTLTFVALLAVTTVWTGRLWDLLELRMILWRAPARTVVFRETRGARFAVWVGEGRRGD
jgi:hypothetical protein